jgi:cytochrome c-type biogenesis protein
MDAPLALAVAAGMAATVNPCGFALLPAYVSAFLGADHRSGGAGALGRALAVSGAMTCGFVVVFGLFGVLVTPLALSIEGALPWVTVVIGIALAGLGIALLAGKHLTLRIPRLSVGGRDGTVASMFLFGVSYAVASLSCTIGPFLAVTTSTFRSSSVLAGVAVFGAYALGMGIVIGTLTVALAFAKSSVVHRLRRVMTRIDRVAGGVMLLAGLYVAWYGWYELRVRNGTTRDPIVDRAVRVQSWVQNRLVPDDATVVGWIGLAALAGAAVVVGARRRAHRRRRTL